MKTKIQLLFGLPVLVLIVLLFVVLFRFIHPPFVCNGSEQLCSKRLNEVVFAATHNAMGIEQLGFFGPTQTRTITQQLEGGIRAFMIDTHYFDTAASIESYIPNATTMEKIAIELAVDKIGFEKRDGVYSCHIMCNLGYIPLVHLLSEFRTFLDTHPNEIIVLSIEDKITPEDTEKAFLDSGLLSYTFIKETGKNWPTLYSMIKSGKRVAVMAEVNGPPPVWYLHQWDYVEETPYEFKSKEDISCAPNRGGTGKDFFLLNNWIERVIPSKEDAKSVNSYDALKARIHTCEKERGRKINFVAVNFFEEGDLVKLVNEMNMRR